MPANKLALIRYKTIDKCLQNRFRRWSLEDLIDAVSDVLYEYEGINSGISKRTIQLDIQNMRSDKLGYNAPIVVVNRKFYTYEDKDYSITKSSLSPNDIEVLQDTLKLLGQFQGFKHFEDISAIVGRVEDKLNLQKENTVRYIDLEKNELLVGLHWIDPLLRSIKNCSVIEINYQSYKARNPSARLYNPYLLKEYRNRWFLLCSEHKKEQVYTLALDRMKGIEMKPDEFFKEPKGFIPQEFFTDVIGVTKSINQPTVKVVLKFDPSNAPYVVTKPLHPSQKIVKQEDGFIYVQIQVVLNFELERVVIGFGENVEVLAPGILRKRIINKLNRAICLYSDD